MRISTVRTRMPTLLWPCVLLVLGLPTCAAAEDALFEAWAHCASSKARAFGVTNDPKAAAHGILAECAPYEVNFLIGLRQTGVPDPGRDLEAAEVKVFDLAIANFGPK